MVRKTSSFISESKVEIGSYHIIGFCKLTLPEWRQMLEYSRCDWGFKQGFRLEPERAWVLRIGGKIDLKTREIKKPSTSLVKVFPFPTKRQLSLPYFKFFHSLGGAGAITQGFNFDSLGAVHLIHYSGRKGKHKKREPYIWKVA